MEELYTTRMPYALSELEALQLDSASTRRYEDRLRDVLAVAPANLAARLKLEGAPTFLALALIGPVANGSTSDGSGCTASASSRAAPTVLQKRAATLHQ